MKFDTYRINKRKKHLISLGIFLVIVFTIIVATSLAKYKTTQSIPLVNGTISYSPSDIIIEAYLDSKLVEDFPTNDGSIVYQEVICDNNATGNFDTNTWTLKMTDVSQKGTKCKIYFVTNTNTSANHILAGKTISERTDFSTILTTNTTGTIFTAEDDDGTSYYYAGAPTDNWFYFGGFYWRIIRINGDGTIRLIYNGTSTTTTGTGTQTTTSVFNSSYNNNAYVGYMYTVGSLRGTGTSSTIKGVLDSWYDSNLASYESYIDTNAGFCGDRTPYVCSEYEANVCITYENGGGTGTTITDYGSYVRYFNSGSPTLKCANSGDLYTKSGASKGNKALTKPIGLITMDEVGYAGADMGLGSDDNTSYYLYTGQSYYTMSPYAFSSGYASVFFVNSNGSLHWLEYVNDIHAVRPVINLRADVKLTGSGSTKNPYIVEGAE